LGCSKPGAGASKQWPTPATIEGLRSPLLGAQYTGGPQIPESALTGIEQSILRFLESLQKERIRRHAQKHASQNDPLRLNWRIPGEITSLVTDGDFLWLGAANYFGNYLIALHQPSQTLAGYVKIEGQPASIAVADSQVFVGTAYGDKPLLQIEKKDILSVPRNRWVDLAISPTERRDLIRGMPLTDQAIYAYYADDDAQIADLLENLNPGKATLEQMFLLAFSYDACGLNHPGLARTWFERIVARSPDSPWAKAARSALASNDEALKRNAREAALLERYDRNHDGTLDPTEREAMKKDPKFQQEEASLNLEQLDIQLAEIVKRFDRNGDGKLNREELQWLRSSVLVFSQADPGSLAGHKILVAPLLSKHFPSEDNLLKHYDANHDGGLDANELRLVAHDVQKDR
jgi:Ca2+-binding EF-hand superfamily protein